MGNFAARATKAVEAVKNLGALRGGMLTIGIAFVLLMGLAVYLGFHDYQPACRIQTDPNFGKYIVYRDTLYLLVKPELKQGRSK